MKTTTKSKIKAMSPCTDGFKWYCKNFTQRRPKIADVVNKLIETNNAEWANWFIVRCMTHEQRIQYSIFAAEQVIDIYEKKYPDDARPRKAIEAAKAYLKKQSKENRDAAYAAANAAAHAAYAAANAAYAAANAAYAAADAANAAAYAAAYAAAMPPMPPPMPPMPPPMPPMPPPMPPMPPPMPPMPP